MGKFGDEFNIEKIKLSELTVNSDVEELVANKVADGAGIGGAGAAAGEEEGKKHLLAIVLGSVVVTTLIFVICVIVWRARRKNNIKNSEAPEKLPKSGELNPNARVVQTLTAELRSVICELNDCKGKLEKLKTAVSVCDSALQNLKMQREKFQSIMNCLEVMADRPADEAGLEAVPAVVEQTLRDLQELQNMGVLNQAILANLWQMYGEFKESVKKLDANLKQAGIINANGDYSNFNLNRYAKINDSALIQLIKEFDNSKVQLAEIYSSNKERDVIISSGEGTQISMWGTLFCLSMEQNQFSAVISSRINMTIELQETILQRLAAVEGEETRVAKVVAERRKYKPLNTKRVL